MYVEYLIKKDNEPIEKSLPLLLVEGKYIKPINHTVDGNKIRVEYGEEVKGLRFCNTIDEYINFSNRITELIHVDTDYFTDISLMFNNCDYLTSINLNGCNTSNVINMRSMFAECSNLEEVFINDLDITKVEDMDCMFLGCTKLRELNISKWNTFNLVDISYMFYKCSSLTYINMSNFNTRNVENYTDIFTGTNNLTIEVGSNFKIDDLDVTYDKHITCTDIVLNPDTEQKVLNKFRIIHTIIPENTNMGETVITTSDNIKYLGNFDYEFDVNKGVEGTVSITHDSITKTADITYKRYIEYTLADVSTDILENNIPFLYYKDGTRNQEYIAVRIYLKNGTILTKLDKTDILVSEIDKVRLYYSNSANIIGLKFYEPGSVIVKAIKNINYIETTGFTDCSFMFYNCQYLDSMDLNKFVWKDITNTRAMFYNTANIKSIDLSEWSSENIEDYYRMFYRVNKNCNIKVGDNWLLTEVDTDFVWRETIVDENGKITENVIEGVFEGLTIRCTDIIFSQNRIILDEGNNIFTLTYKLVPNNTRDTVTINLGNGIKAGLKNQYTIDTTLQNSTFIEVICGNVIKRCEVEYVTDPFIEYTVDNTIEGTYAFLDEHMEIRYDEEGKEIKTIKGCTIPSLIDKYGYYSKNYKKTAINVIKDDGNLQTETSLHQELSKVKSVRLYYDPTNIIGIKFFDGDLNHRNYKSYIKEIKYINTKNFTDMDYMFNNCTSLESFDHSILNTDKVTTMRYMFNGCNGLETLNLSDMNVSKVLWFTGMFQDCINLKELKLDHWNTQKADVMDKMFWNCSSLETLNLYSFNTPDLRSLAYFLNNCSSLKSINIKNLDTTNVTTLNSMFSNCSSLESIDLSNFNTPNLMDMTAMFYGCTNLKSVNLKSFNTTNVNTMYGLFQNCTSLNKINIKNFNFQNVNIIANMFAGCSSLLEIDLRNIITDHDINMNYLFDGCTSLITTELTSFNTEYIKNYLHMFRNVPNICEIYTGLNWNLTESATSFTGKFNSRYITYEASKEHEYCIGYDMNGQILGDENNLPSLINIKDDNNHYTFTLYENNDCQGLYATNIGVKNSISHKRYMIDLSQNDNNTTEVFIEVGLQCNTSLYDKLIVEISTSPELPTLEFEPDVNKRFMSYNYYKNRLYIHSALVTTGKTYYLHLAYIKSNNEPINDELALVRYIKIKTDSDFFDNYADRAFEPTNCVFNSIDVTKINEITPVYFTLENPIGSGSISINNTNGLVTKSNDGAENKFFVIFNINLSNYEKYFDTCTLKVTINKYIKNEGFARGYILSYENNIASYYYPIFSEDTNIDKISSFNTVLKSGHNYQLKFELDNGAEIQIAEITVNIKTQKDIFYNALLDFTNINSTNIIEDELEKIVIDNNILSYNDPNNNLPSWITTGFNCKYPMLNAYKYNTYSLTTTNFNYDNTCSNRYFKLDLTKIQNPVTINIKYNLSTECSKDYFAIHLTHTPETPNINTYKDRLLKTSGLYHTNIDDIVTTTISKPGIYYLHFNYKKDENNRNGYDSVMIKEISISSRRL